MGPAHWDPKAISPFALPGVKKHRLFEELARSFCALDRQGKRAADGPGPDPFSVRGGMVPFFIFVVAYGYRHVGYTKQKKAIRKSISVQPF